MVKVTVIRDRPTKRILKCREGNKIWYQLWLTELDMICIERFFYEKNGGRRKVVLGKDRTKVLINSIP